MKFLENMICLSVKRRSLDSKFLSFKLINDKMDEGQFLRSIEKWLTIN